MTCALLVAGCSGISDATRQEAIKALVAVRPGVQVEDVELHVASYWHDPRPYLESGDGTALFRLRHEVYAACIGPLLRARLIRDTDLEPIRQAFINHATIDLAGIAFPESAVAFVFEGYEENVPVLVHELAHVASYRLGYIDAGDERIFLRKDGVSDPNFIDLDAILARSMMVEADATASERVATAYANGGTSAVDAFWTEKVRVDSPTMTGPLTITHPDGTVFKLKAGESYYAPSTIPEALSRIAYGGSLALIQARHAKGECLELTLRNAWSTLTHRTHEFLYPTDTGRASRLAQFARALEGEVTGAIHIGSFLTREMLMRSPVVSRTDATALVRDLVDDLLVRSGTEDFCWVTAWSDEGTARRFAEIYAGIVPDATVTSDGSHVIARFGNGQVPRELLAP